MPKISCASQPEEEHHGVEKPAWKRAGNFTFCLTWKLCQFWRLRGAGRTFKARSLCMEVTSVGIMWGDPKRVTLSIYNNTL